MDDLKVLDGYAINSGEAAAGLVNKDVARGWFSGVQNNGLMNVNCEVTLDGSTERRGQPFPLTTYTVKREMRIIKNIPVGTSPSAIVSNSAGTRVYVTYAPGNSITVIDTDRNEVIHTITNIGELKARPQLTISNDGSRLYVSLAHAVHCINTTSYATILTISKRYANALALNGPGTHLYVTVSFYDQLPEAKNYVVRYNALNGSTLANLGNNFWEWSSALVNPEGTRLYLGSGWGTYMMNISSSQYLPENVPGRVLGTMAYSQNSRMGSRLYLPVITENMIAISNTDRLTNIKKLIGMSAPHSIAIDPTTHMAYFTQQTANTVSIINTLTEEVVGQITGFNRPEGITILPNGVIYVANNENNTVSVVSN
ncbi:hypothetical protein G7025_03335 [Pseudomonas lurida]|nr:hypothetical protein [Pseudomonas lurida]